MLAALKMQIKQSNSFLDRSDQWLVVGTRDGDGQDGAEVYVGGLLRVEEHRRPGDGTPRRLRRGAKRRLDGLQLRRDRRHRRQLVPLALASGDGSCAVAAAAEP